MSDTLLPFRLNLLHELIRIRMVEEAIADRYPEQEMRCPVHLSIGQEAAAVGVCTTLETRDRVMSAHRAHAHYLAKGGCLDKMIAELYGKATGCTSGKGGSMHLVDLDVNFMGSTPIVCGSLPVAVGLAFGDRLAGEDRVSVAFIGEAATEEGTFTESLNFAVLHQLPILIVCENNLYSSYSPMEVRQPHHRSRIGIAEAHGCRALIGDGNRIDDVYELAKPAVDAIRAGEGPIYLDLETYRWREHCGPYYDNDLGYRTQEEAEEWMERCPIRYWTDALREINEVCDSTLDLFQEHLKLEIEEAFRKAQAAPIPSPKELFTDVYATAPL